MSKLNSKDRIERAARLYTSNADAGRALNMAASSFGRLCRRYGILTPRERKQHQETAACKP